MIHTVQDYTHQVSERGIAVVAASLLPQPVSVGAEVEEGVETPQMLPHQRAVVVDVVHWLLCYGRG